MNFYIITTIYKLVIKEQIYTALRNAMTWNIGNQNLGYEMQCHVYKQLFITMFDLDAPAIEILYIYVGDLNLSSIPFNCFSLG